MIGWNSRSAHAFVGKPIIPSVLLCAVWATFASVEFGCSSPTLVDLPVRDSGESVDCEEIDYAISDTDTPAGWEYSFPDLLDFADGMTCSWVGEPWEDFRLSVQIGDNPYGIPVYSRAVDGICKQSGNVNVVMFLGDEAAPVTFTVVLTYTIDVSYSFFLYRADIEAIAFDSLPLPRPESDLWNINFLLIVPVGGDTSNLELSGEFKDEEYVGGEVFSEFSILCR